MKRIIIWSVWALFPVAAIALHAGPGQELMARDDAARMLARAQQAERAADASDDEADWESAMKLYGEARALLPEQDTATALRLRFSQARCKARTGDLVDGGEDLRAVLTDALREPKPDESLIADIRGQLGIIAHATSWAMRLEGATTEEWMEESEDARQQFRLLAEASLAGKREAKDQLENIEAIVRFQDLSDDQLRAAPPPKECKNCKNGVCKNKRKQKMSKSKPQQPKDAREDVKKGETQWRPKGS